MNKELIEQNAVVIATKDKKVHQIVVIYVKVVEEKIIITDNYMKKTIENIKKNPDVNLLIFDRRWPEDKFKSEEIHGKAEYYTEGKWLDLVKKLPENADMPCKGVLVVKPI
ncbi:pyridoxamine 5'-phosphate oxidase family protein [Pseudomonadota bacterium]